MWLRHDVEARMADFLALSSARDAAELHRALVLGRTAAYEREPTTPMHYFTSIHEHDREGAITTAMLLATDGRWTSASGPLMHRLASSGLIDDDHLDLLARAFVAAGPKVYWECPDDWFDGPEILIAVDETADAADDVDEDNVDEEESPAVVARAIPAGVRRWAVERLVRKEPSAWGLLLSRAREVDAPSAAAIVRGVLDAIDALPAPARQWVITAALDWSRADVRLAALELLSESDPDAARDRALQDADAKVRRRGAQIGSTSAADDYDRSRASAPVQAALF